MAARGGLLLLGVLAAGCVPERTAGPAGEAIECALRGAAQFARDCTVERAEEGGVLKLTVRHPDGGFRRFTVLDDGRGLAVADGADAAEVRLDGEILDVAVGEDRYRFPATRKGA